MRELVKSYLESINYDKSMMRWETLNFNDRHISEINFNELTDQELFDIFKKVHKRANQLM